MFTPKHVHECLEQFYSYLLTMENYPSAPQLCNCMVDKQTMIHQYNGILFNDKE